MTTKKKTALQQFVEDVKFLGYTNYRAADGVDKKRLGQDYFVGYHAVRFWLNGTNSIPALILKEVQKRVEHKRALRKALKKKKGLTK